MSIHRQNSKNQQITKPSFKSSVDLENHVMSKIKTGQIKMRPRCYFWLGSMIMTFSLIGLIITSAFLLNIIWFLLRTHGPMSQWRFQQMITSFPWWLPAFTVVSLITGLWLLRKYDFSYRRNFIVIALVFLLATLGAAALIQASGINETWSHQGPMKRLYRMKSEPKVPFQHKQNRGKNQQPHFKRQQFKYRQQFRSQ